MDKSHTSSDFTSLIEAAYRLILLRNVDPVGLQDWRLKLEAGSSSIFDCMDALLRSEEFREKSLVFLRHYTESDALPFFNDNSQNGEVGLLLREMIGIGELSKIAVDIGAHGRVGSNTYDLLRYFGWRGILVEANPRLVPKIETEFSGCNFDLVNVAVSDKPGRAKLYLGVNDQISSIHREWTSQWGDIHDAVEIDVETLPSILDRFAVPKHFGLLSIDAEGEGLNLLEDAIAAGYRPKWIIFEAHDAPNIESLNQLPLSELVRGAYDIAGKTSSNLIVRLRQP
ncbi:MAG: FkbM family methyltransferase [Roseomonas sp.]|nr:FkbM family methyltransferase [Roseomonas sp.]